MKFQKLLKITSRTSSITNSFVQAIIPGDPPSQEDLKEALHQLGMSEGRMECVYCGAPATDADHLMPLVRRKQPTGYLHEIRNLVPCCGPCNQSKGGSDWRAWMLSKATGSPTSRNIPDVAGKIERLERYVIWGNLKPLPLKELVGNELWDEYWAHLRLIETALAAAQEKAVHVQKAIRVALSRHVDSSERHRPELVALDSYSQAKLPPKT
jgi:hypothetical protein